MKLGILTGILVSTMVLSGVSMEVMAGETVSVQTEVMGEAVFQDTLAASASDFMFEDGVILKYLGSSRDVIEIPSEINGQVVHTIGEGAFYNKIMITSVVIPSTVHTIETKAFQSCTNLTTLTIPYSVNVIGVGAFTSCTNVKTVNYGGTASQRDGILTGGNSYFFSNPQWNYQSASAGTGSTLPSGTGVPGVPYYSNVSPESDFLFSDGVITKYVGSGSSVVVIPSSIRGEAVTTIGASAFFNVDTVLAVAIPSTVEVIEVNGFQACGDLVSIILPSSLKVVGNSAFTSCTSLKGVYYGGSREDWGKVISGNNTALENVSYWEYSSSLAGKTSSPSSILGTMLGMPETSSGDFTYYDGVIQRYNGSGDSVVVIPEVIHGEKVVGIGSQAFQNKNTLLAVVIPETVEVIGERAFESCSNLRYVTLPASVEEIGASSFSGSGSLSRVYYGGSLAHRGDISMSNNTTLENIPTWEYYSLSISEPEPEPEPEEETGDLVYSSWAESFVVYSEEAGLLSPSYGSNYTRAMTREQVAELLVRVVEGYTGRVMTRADMSVFSDTNNTYVLKAVQNGIVSGRGDSIFAPSDTVTREELAVMLVKTVDVMEKLTGRVLVERNTAISGFGDLSQVSSWALEHVGVMVNLGIISGVSGGMLEPKSSATVEQCLVMACNLFTI